MRHNLLHIFLTSILMFAFSSCIMDHEDDPVEGDTLMSIGFEVNSRAAQGPIFNDGYEDGLVNENVDLANGNYRIYFFDNDNKYITTFRPLFVTTQDETNGTNIQTVSRFHCVGIAPNEMLDVADFKVLILANCPNYPTDLIPGTTTIDDLCKHSATKFSCQPTDGPAFRMPFFGLRQFSNVTLVKGQRTELNGVISLLRAMAKIEVILDPEVKDNFKIKSASITRYNAQGFCAPAKVYTEGAYIKNNWEGDYTNSSNINIPEQTALTDLAFTEVTGTDNQTFRVYVPEYANTGDNATAAKIEVKFDFQKETDAPYVLYFQKYTDSQRDETKEADYDILRNNIYRYVVAIKDGKFSVDVIKWIDVFDNDYDFTE